MYKNWKLALVILVVAGCAFTCGDIGDLPQEQQAAREALFQRPEEGQRAQQEGYVESWKIWLEELFGPLLADGRGEGLWELTKAILLATALVLLPLALAREIGERFKNLSCKTKLKIFIFSFGALGVALALYVFVSWLEVWGPSLFFIWLGTLAIGQLVPLSERRENFFLVVAYLPMVILMDLAHTFVWPKPEDIGDLEHL
ncbi:MAG: hypothetical protein PVJ09_04390 [Candidatus Woesebacteria bacterium]|jgi:hypothetical protein